MIDQFREQYDFLSNFHPSPIKYEGIMYPTVEHAYQAQKTHDEGERRRIAAIRGPGAAKLAGKKIKVRLNWFSYNLQLMYDLVLLKFSLHPVLRQQLLDTGKEELVEGNNWGDVFWGRVDGVGKNHLGKILMQVRTELRREF